MRKMTDLKQAIVTLAAHTGTDKEARYYCNAHRISKDRYDLLRERAVRLDCFFSTSKRVGGTFRRINYVNAWLPFEVIDNRERAEA